MCFLLKSWLLLSQNEHKVPYFYIFEVEGNSCSPANTPPAIYTDVDRNRNTQHYGVTPFEHPSYVMSVQEISYQKCMSPLTNVNPEEYEHRYIS